MASIVSMMRNEMLGDNTRLGANDNVPFAARWYEQLYTSSGPQEWILLPDPATSGVVISFPAGAGSAYLEATCSPPQVIKGVERSPLNGSGPISPVAFTLQDTVTEVTFVQVAGPSAVRVNVVGGTVGISVRC